ncbi:alpha/beta hydrolase [Streptomyces sp. NA04227]|nr:alpha/beta hydrolase [Streptomyces sp. NA04227]
MALEAAHHPGPEPGGDLAVVLAHGFTGALDRPHLRRAAGVLSRYAPVITFSFRGHGGSGGRSTVGDREVLDLEAAIAWARELGYRRIVSMGFSMGGSVVLRHAALERERRAGELRDEGEQRDQGAEGAQGAEGDQGRAGHRGHEGCEGRAGGARIVAVVSVSAPARWFYRGTAPMRRLHWMVLRPEGRIVGRLGFGTRIHSRHWDPVPPSPVESVPHIAPTPLLLVHGDRDPYFPLDHPRMLAAAAGANAELWVEPGMGHAENAAPDATLARVGEWILRAAARDRDGPEPEPK